MARNGMSELRAYADYCEACRSIGEEPLTIEEWLESNPLAEPMIRWTEDGVDYTA